MTPEQRERLKQVIDNTIEGNAEQSQTHFHQYFERKMRELVNPPADVDDDNDDE